MFSVTNTCRTGRRFAAGLALALLAAHGVARAEPPDLGGGLPAPVTALDSFLDRLMLAESGGRDYIRNPRSTAYGAFQFLDQTFLALVQRHFPVETAALTPAQILALRADRAFARRVAAAFTTENARALMAAGLAPNWPNLRLAFFAGPSGAVKVLKSPANASVAILLGPAAVKANPFLSGMTAEGLIAWSARTIDGRRRLRAPIAVADAMPYPGTAHKAALPARAGKSATRGSTRLAGGRGISIPPLGLGGPSGAAPPARVRPPCNVGLAACRHWVALAEKRLTRQRQANLRR